MSEALMTANVVPVGTGRVSTLLDVNASCMSVNQEELENGIDGDIFSGLQQGKGSFEGTYNPEVTPYGNFMTPRHAGDEECIVEQPRYDP
eukprot:gnl/Chilomastix_caulleri/797.p3 GENE.gnl/Chilomastix_caulleri/797~~gnl/Chilomastix_caulleri/797.p3  ORF type:complete len:90 (-),score=23.78 gnl/Chilomastix_caulleri/797:572-841(-)